MTIVTHTKSRTPLLMLRSRSEQLSPHTHSISTEDSMGLSNVLSRTHECVGKLAVDSLRLVDANNSTSKMIQFAFNFIDLILESKKQNQNRE